MKKILVSVLCLLLFQGFTPDVNKSGQKNFSDIIRQSRLDRKFNSIGIGSYTFLKDYRKAPSLTADYSLGSPTATFTATRSASAPATYVDESGKIHLVTTSDVPRFQGGYYDATGFHAAKGLIIEGERTNLRQYANVGSDWTVDKYDANGIDIYSGEVNNYGFWSNENDGLSVSISSDSTYGSSLLMTVTDSGTTADSIEFWSNQVPFSVTTGTAYTISLYIKCSKVLTGTLQLMQFAAPNADWGGGAQEFTTVANTWIRISKTFTASGTGQSQIYLECGNNGTFTMNLANFQVEAAPYASSFIPTTTAALTRGADVLTYLNSGNRTAGTETIVMKYMPLGANFSNDGTFRYLLDNDGDRRVIKKNGTQSFLLGYPNVNDSSSVVTGGNDSAVAGTSYVVSAVYQHASPYAEWYTDGVSEDAYTAGDYTANEFGDKFYIGNTGDSQLFGLIQGVAIFSDAKSAGDVAKITAAMNA